MQRLHPVHHKEQIREVDLPGILVWCSKGQVQIFCKESQLGSAEGQVTETIKPWSWNNLYYYRRLQLQVLPALCHRTKLGMILSGKKILHCSTLLCTQKASAENWLHGYKGTLKLHIGCSWSSEFKFPKHRADLAKVDKIIVLRLPATVQAHGDCTWAGQPLRGFIAKSL